MLAFRSAFIASATALVVALFATVALAEERLALVIGNDSYENLPQLQKARNDARAVSGLLQELGYDATLIEDADRRTLSKALSDIAQRIEPGAEVIFYFAGHGVEISGRNYLIPVDAPAAGPEEEAFLTAESLAVDQVLETIQSRGARITLLILDACRDNPFPKADTRSVGSERGLAPVAAPEGTFILFSAGAGQAALDGMGAQDGDPNSVFTRALLRLMQDGDRPFQEIARAIRREVETMAATINHKQRPAYYDELTDDFYLVSAAPVRGAKPIDDPGPSTQIATQDKLGVAPPKKGDDASIPEVPAEDTALADGMKRLKDLENDPCIQASLEYNELQTPYEISDLMEFSQKHAGCPIAESAKDLAGALRLANQPGALDDIPLDRAEDDSASTVPAPEDDPFHIAAADIPDTLVDDPCFYAGQAMVKLEYPYKVEDLLAFAKEHAGCEGLAQSAIDMADAFKDIDPATLVPETWRIKKGVSEGYMNVRDGRGTTFPVLFRLPEGTGGLEVKICLPPETGEGKKDWCMIEHEGQRGWVSSGGIERE
ncbi:caspase family protein [Tabrizicola sp.]|uniref:caspase family protein n=1 Tax=Tabrizicola sp. TaxID=2005166 RepID=UPI003F2DB726